ncbi:ABC transporter substrate-binding protein [Gordonia neofelifaecis]|uniref:Extracellular solute-binding protein family 5 n=1 Tax=Gordonia neofelifaecis NRRL B-59395 TaxID=644548 RepID=F1YMD7_9ACTN|nr:ABC transporter substrate-binding protein [Gordonia neofelifaecis]EGD54186.1 extracellular solute-binding protein family 5 [Gordonia neofelifaecis NRRL B-59395]
MNRSKFYSSAAAAATAMIAAGSLAACGNSDSTTTPGQLAAATLVDVQSFDPAANPGQGQRIFLDPVYDTLLRTDPNGNVVAGVATKFELTPQALVLDLQQGRVFSDGEPLDAAAVKANLDGRRKSTGPAAAALSDIADVQVESPTRVRINLATPSPALPISLTDVAGVLVAPNALNSPQLGTDPIGSGPYVLDTAATKKGVSYVYTRNEKFTDKSVQTLDRIEIRVLTDDAARASALRSGQVDLSQVAAGQADAVKSSGIEIGSFPGNYWMLQFLDTAGTKAPALGNTKARQAVCSAIDSQQIVKSSFFGHGTAQSQVFPEGNEFHVKSLENVYPFDTQKAQSLVKESGVPDPTFAVPAFGPIKPVAEAVQGNLRDAGIDMSIQLVQPGTLDKENRETNFPAILTPIKQVHPEQLYTDRLAKDGPQNPFHVAHPAVDAAHARAVAATDDAARVAAYADMQRAAADEALWCGLFQQDAIVGWNTSVHGVTNTAGWPMGPSFRGITVD